MSEPQYDAHHPRYMSWAADQLKSRNQAQFPIQVVVVKPGDQEIFRRKRLGKGERELVVISLNVKCGFWEKRVAATVVEMQMRVYHNINILHFQPKPLELVDYSILLAHNREDQRFVGSPSKGRLRFLNVNWVHPGIDEVVQPLD